MRIWKGKKPGKSSHGNSPKTICHNCFGEKQRMKHLGSVERFKGKVGCRTKYLLKQRQWHIKRTLERINDCTSHFLLFQLLNRVGQVFSAAFCRRFSIIFRSNCRMLWRRIKDSGASTTWTVLRNSTLLTFFNRVRFKNIMNDLSTSSAIFDKIDPQ